jgi:hypothetical protein
MAAEVRIPPLSPEAPAVPFAVAHPAKAPNRMTSSANFMRPKVFGNNHRSQTISFRAGAARIKRNHSASLGRERRWRVPPLRPEAWSHKIASCPITPMSNSISLSST